MEVPPDSLQREEVSKNDLGRRSPWWGRRKEGTSDLKHSWSQFLVGFIHPVWWNPPDDGRLCESQLLVVWGEEEGGEGEPSGTPFQTTSMRGVDLLSFFHITRWDTFPNNINEGSVDRAGLERTQVGESAPSRLEGGSTSAGADKV